MASNRHLGRIIVLQSLYEYEFRTKAGDATADINAIVAKDIEPYSRALGDTEFVYTLANDIAGKIDQLDTELQPMAPEWPLDTIAAIDRNILRIGLHELAACAEAVPPKVAINEAVELAKAFGSENSSKFVNGVLGTAYRKIYEGDNTMPTPKHQSAKAAKKSAKPSAAKTAETSAPEPASAAPVQEEQNDQKELQDQSQGSETSADR